MKRATISALFIILAASLIIGCGGNNSEEEARLVAKDQAQELINTYVNYLNTEEPGLLNQIAESYPECITESEQGRKIDESILLNYVNSYEVDLTELTDYYENLFDANKYPLEAAAESYYYSQPMFKEGSYEAYEGPIPVSFTLEGPWDFTQGPIDETLIETTTMANTNPNYADYQGATYAISRGLSNGTVTQFESKNETAVYDYGHTADITVFGRNVYIYTYNAPNLMVHFPIKVGKTWRCDYELFENGKSVGTMQKEKTVVSKNTIHVPAGTYEDAYLVQVKGINSTTGTPFTYIAYIWYVPYIGEVASIESLNNEKNEVFAQASSFKRLKFTTYSKPEKVEEVEDEEQPVGEDSE
jgi:hypothetical protein